MKTKGTPRKKTLTLLTVLMLAATAAINAVEPKAPGIVHPNVIPIVEDKLIESFAEAFLNLQDGTGDLKSWTNALLDLEQRWPIQMDWVLQDAGLEQIERWFNGDYPQLVVQLCRKIEPGLKTEECSIERYLSLCTVRRKARLAKLTEQRIRILVVEGWDYNEGRTSHVFPSDFTPGEFAGKFAEFWRFQPGSKLLELTMDASGVTERTLLDDPKGMFRDPDVSFDGERVLFSWRKAEKTDDFHLYEMNLSSGMVRQLTEGLGFADIEGCYLPNGDIVFNSTRCVIAVPCMGLPVLNLYRCNPDGGQMRRLGFDQVSTMHPKILSDGRVVFTRWEYNDRNPVYLQPLMQMNPDGTGQVEYYGGNSSWPTSLHHARPIPGTHKLLAVASGHHTWQAGLLVEVDRRNGQEQGEGLELLGPRRPFPAGRIAEFPHGETPHYQYPWPLNEDECIVGVSVFPRRNAGKNRFEEALLKRNRGRPISHHGIYWAHSDGSRELLAKKPGTNLFQPVVLAPRTRPPVIPDRVDRSAETGISFIQNIYVGEGMTGVQPGAARTLRVVELKYRTTGIGVIMNILHGAVHTPVSRNGSWDVKEILGDATIHEDGSVMVEIPARRPFYFQVLDADGRLIQTMRSWTVLMPGENMSCVGCHESQNQTPVAITGRLMAMRQGPQTLRPFYDVRGGFSFNRHIQPILDQHCIKCHDGDRWESGAPPPAVGNPPMSLLSRTSPPFHGKRKWSDAYLGLLRPRPVVNLKLAERIPLGDKLDDLVNPPDPSGGEAVVPPYARGSGNSRLMKLLKDGHKDVKLTHRELDLIAAWIDLGVPYCGDYAEANNWTPEELAQYRKDLAKREQMEAVDFYISRKKEKAP